MRAGKVIQRGCLCLSLSTALALTTTTTFAKTSTAEQPLDFEISISKYVSAKKTLKGGKVEITGTAQACKIVGQGFSATCAGSVLKAKITQVTPNDSVAYSYQWYNGSTKIAGAKGSQYQLKYPADVGGKIWVQVIAKKAGYEDLKFKSAPTQPAQALSTKIVATTTSHEAGQASINACKGGLTHMKNVSDVLGQTYLPIENACGGMPILFLQKGDLVQIEDVGVFQVIDLRDVPKGGDTSHVRGIKGTHLLQTCHPTNSRTANLMRIVGLQPV